MIYNVKDFGAIGNGAANDTAAIQAAVDAARAAGGGSVFLPAGTYIVTGGSEPSDGCIMLYDNISIIGEGMGASTIKVKDDWNKGITGILRTEYGVETENVSVMNITLDGNKANNTSKIDGWFNGYIPEQTGQDTNITLNRVEIKNCSGYGFDPHERTVNLTITNCISHDNGLDGFTLDFQIDGLVQNNTAYNNGRHGFNVVTSTYDLELINNTAYGNGGAGIMVQRGSEDIAVPHNILIQGGTYFNNGKDGIQVNKANEVIIDNVDVHHNGERGIRIYGSVGSVIKNSDIHDNSRLGDNKFDEIYIQSYDDTNGASGRIYFTRNTLIENNEIYNTGTLNANYGIREANDGTDYTTIKNNDINGTNHDDPQVNGSHSVIIGEGGEEPPPPPTGYDDVHVITWADWLDPATPKITGFETGAGKDAVDVRQLLEHIGYTGTNAVADGYIKLADISSGMKIQFDEDGPGGSQGAKQIINITGVKVADFSVQHNLIMSDPVPPPTEHDDVHVFTWNDFLDPSTPKLTDFDVGPGGDAIDISAILEHLNYSGNDAVADGYVKFANISSGMKIQIDADGNAGGQGAKQIVNIAGISVADFSIVDNLIMHHDTV